MSITIRGADDTARHLRQIGDNAEHLTAVHQRQGEEVARGTVVTAIDSGTLRDSIEVLHADEDGFAVGSRVPYARFVFRGTIHQPPRPPKVPAFGPRAAEAISREVIR